MDHIGRVAADPDEQGAEPEFDVARPDPGAEAQGVFGGKAVLLAGIGNRVGTVTEAVEVSVAAAVGGDRVVAATARNEGAAGLYIEGVV
ncbi:hypothetical protein, partial [Candidatus Accumulibacter vicinus]|uniref:hypothetical protein n=1 Tax=Candidatus Accumulibacter vicinus TaxID=2954382 RepID=UPI00235B6CE4